MICVQDSISKCLHHHTLFGMLSDRILETHHAWILSCFGFKVGTWFITWSIFSTFQLSSPIFSIVLQMCFKLPHPSITSLSWNVCTHPINLMGIHLLHCTHGNEHTRPHDAIPDTFVAIMRDVGFHVWW
jgi:hypothetical protein